jgi:flavin-dependent dehydrogenase
MAVPLAVEVDCSARVDDMIAATLSLEQAAQRGWDVCVVGAGPAGALVSVELSRCGASVLLVDRADFPRAKVCGCCINERALSALSSAGLADLPSQAGAVGLHSVCLAAGRRVARLRLSGGVALSRSTFDSSLVRSAIHFGTAFLPGTVASLGPLAIDHRRVELQQGARKTEVMAKVVLAADGLGGMLLSRSKITSAPARAGSRIGAGVVMDGAESFYAPGVIYMTCGQAGYLGLVRLEDGRLDLACAVDTSAVRAAKGPGELAGTLIDEASWPVPRGLADQPWRGTAPLTRQAGRVAGERVFALGDATGYVEPFTGEGIAWALASAIALTPLVLRAVRTWQPSLAAEWTSLHRRIITRRQGACRLLAGLLRKPWLTAAGVAVLARLPMLAAPVVRYLNHPDSFLPLAL